MDVLNKIPTKGKKAVQFVLLLVLGCVLIWFSLEKINLADLVETIRHARFIVAIPVFAVSLLGYYIRSLRWKLLLGSMHTHTRTSFLFASLSIGYAVNIATPRLGEIARCLVLRKAGRVPLEQSGISVVVERVVDICSLALVVLVASIIQANASADFIRRQVLAPIVEKLDHTPWLLLLLVFSGGLLVLWSIRKLIIRWKNNNTFLQRSVDAVQNIFHLRQKGRFLMYTVLIWLCYFLMTYLWFSIFDETKNLGLTAAFVLMAVGSIGRSVPIQGGGMGAYHYLVSNAFTLFGVGLVTGNAMAFVIHGAQIVFTFVLGLVCWIWILFNEQRYDEV